MIRAETSTRLLGVVLLALMAAISNPAVGRAARVTGRVTDAGNRPVEGALVRYQSDGGPVGITRTDQRGDFEIDGERTMVLEFEHSGFETRRLELGSVPERQIVVVLTRRSDVVRDEIAVSASRSQGSLSAQSIAASVVNPRDSIGAPNAIGDMVAEVPGVSQNGQGGLFQTYSVRGVSRQRVLTLVEGMRVVSERRAGVSASFLDPLLVGSVEVVRGPSSTYWGSGALGGVIQLFPRRFGAPTVTAGYSTDGDERLVSVGSGRDADRSAWSWGLAARQALDSETPSGDKLFSGFEQVSATYNRRWTRDRMTYNALIVASRGTDIGKANTDFPERATTYPVESHLMAHLAASHDSGWRFEAWVHPNELETRVEELGESLNLVDNRAFDWGLDAQREVRLTPTRTLRWGVDLLARRSVTAREEARSVTGELLKLQETLSDASEEELGIYGAVETKLGHEATLLAGGRLAVQRQGNSGFESTDDTAATAFLGAVVPLAGGLELTANLGTGLRFPSISERFFSGTTGRGEVTGNAELEPEGSLSADLGLRWAADSLFVSGCLFRSEIDDYIERVETAPDQLTFVNLSSGRIRGVEMDGAWRATSDWTLSFGGHAVEGEDASGEPLADIPPESLFAGWRLERDRWRWRGRWERRFEKNDPGSGEKAIPEADLVSTSVSWQWRPGLGLRLSARNLLDEEYFSSADRRVSLASGRAVSLAVEWQR